MFIRTLALIALTIGLMAPMQPAANAKPDRFTPRAGATFNSPLGGVDKQRAIFRKILRSVDSSRRGSEVYMFTWNFLTRDGTNALLRAQRRGVRVRVIISAGNANIDGVVNQPYRRLKAGLRDGNRGRRDDRTSWARACGGSCRGKTGSAHSKFFMFSHTGRAKRVLMQGSANLTVASTANQWNDIYTHVDNAAAWGFAKRTFTEAAADRPVRRPFTSQRFGSTELLMFPNTGKNSADPVMRLLNQIECRGAKNTRTGRTRIRIAPDVIRNDRGMQLARKVRRLWQSGCDVRIGYTVIGIEIGKMLRAGGGRGPVPLKHLVQDFDGDGDFDNYFHLKSMSVIGNVKGDRSGHAVLNGSANWSGLGKVSDENVGIYRSARVARAYDNHIDYWYNNFPSNRSGREALVFGAGRNAVYADGEPVVDEGEVNPFARIEMD